MGSSYEPPPENESFVPNLKRIIDLFVLILKRITYMSVLFIVLIMRLNELLPLLNEWWRSGSINRGKARSYKRMYFKDLLSRLDERQTVIITGLRRVGKTTLMYQAIEHLISSGTEPKNILYFTFDERVEEVLDVFKEFRKLTGTDWKTESTYVFLDEIQKHRNWSSKIKILYDTHPNIKFVISGSATLKMEVDAMKDLAGRYFFIDMLPLSLKEFVELHMGREIENPDLFSDDIENLLGQFIRKPYPEIIAVEDETRVLEYIKSIVIEKVIFADLPQIKGNFRPEFANALLNMFMSEPGMILNLDNLAKDLKVSKSVLHEHMHYLEFARLIKIVKNFRPSVMAESRKMKRVYPYHISLTTPFKYHQEVGKILECQIRTYLKLEHYWRKGNKEVDFLDVRGNEIIPIEVKWGKKIKTQVFKKMKVFMEKHRIHRGILIYGGNESYEHVLDGLQKVSVIPATKILWDCGY